MTEVGALLERTWREQARGGFLLGDPEAPVETRYADDPASGVRFRFRWLPHRAIRGVPAELARRGVYDPDCEAEDLPVDARDPSGRPCFLCPDMIRACFPREMLVPMEAGGRTWLAGANFAWLAVNHFTVASAVHEDQSYDAGVLAAMVELHALAGGDFRLLYNGSGAGASIPWHLHLQATTEPFPVEGLAPGRESDYPLPLTRFDDPAAADDHVSEWEASSPSHRVNLMVSGPADGPLIHVFLRDSRRPASGELGPMAAFEACGDLVFDSPFRREAFERADLAMARRALRQIHPTAAG